MFEDIKKITDTAIVKEVDLMVLYDHTLPFFIKSIQSISDQNQRNSIFEAIQTIIDKAIKKGVDLWALFEHTFPDLVKVFDITSDQNIKDYVYIALYNFINNNIYKLSKMTEMKYLYKSILSFISLYERNTNTNDVKLREDFPDCTKLCNKIRQFIEKDKF